MTEVLLDAFDGFIEEIRDGIGYCTLHDKDGSEWYGTMPVSDIERHGLREGRRFIARVYEVGEDTVRVKYEDVPDVELTQEQIDDIHKRVDELFRGWDRA